MSVSNTKQRAITFLWLATLLSLPGCGGSDGEDGIRGKRLSDLAAADEAEYCAEVEGAETDAMVDSFWRWDCASRAQIPDVCDPAEIETCLDGIGARECSVEFDVESGLGDCNATVGEFADCLEAYYGQFLQFADADCDTDTSISLITDASALAQCDALQAKCPNELPNF